MGVGVLVPNQFAYDHRVCRPARRCIPRWSSAIDVSRPLTVGLRLVELARRRVRMASSPCPTRARLREWQSGPDATHGARVDVLQPLPDDCERANRHVDGDVRRHVSRHPRPSLRSVSARPLSVRAQLHRIAPEIVVRQAALADSCTYVERAPRLETGGCAISPARPLTSARSCRTGCGMRSGGQYLVDANDTAIVMPAVLPTPRARCKSVDRMFSQRPGLWYQHLIDSPVKGVTSREVKTR